jgi:hypothetical protein
MEFPHAGKGIGSGSARGHRLVEQDYLGWPGILYSHIRALCRVFHSLVLG